MQVGPDSPRCREPECCSFTAKRWYEITPEGLDESLIVCSRKCAKALNARYVFVRNREADLVTRKLTRSERLCNPSNFGCLVCGELHQHRLHPAAPPLCHVCWMCLEQDEKLWWWQARHWSNTIWELVDRVKESQET